MGKLNRKSKQSVNFLALDKVIGGKNHMQESLMLP